MDLKNILSQLSLLSEATKETEKGRVHKAEPGGYGRKFDTDEEGDEKKDDKKTEPAAKRGRGRPKKGADDSGEVKKYDTDPLAKVMGIGKPPKKQIGTVSKKHSLKEWVQEIENKYVAEAVPPGMKPLAILDPMNKQAGAGVVTSKNPAVQKMLGGLDPKDVQIVMTTQQQAMKPGTTQQPTATSGGATNQPAMSEEDYSAKKARAGKDIGKPGKQFAKIAKSAGEKYGSKAAGERVAGAVLAKLRGLKEGDIPSDQVDMGAGLGAGRSQSTFEAKAKPDYIDLDKDGNKKESMKKAAQDAKKKKKVDESMDNRLKSAHHRGKAHALAKESYNCKYDDMEEARMYHEGYKEGLDECYGQEPIVGLVRENPAATVPGMASQANSLDEMDMYEMDKTEYMRQKARTTPGDTFKAFGQTMHDKDVLDDSMFESWDQELNSLLTESEEVTEGMTVSISKGQQGAPDSVSVSAQDGEAEQLLQLIKHAGLGLFGDDSGHMTAGADDQLVSKPGGIDVVGDHDGMMSLIKKVVGNQGDDSADSDDYEDEEGHSEEEHEHTHEETCNECGYMESECGCDKEAVDETESYDQELAQVAEDDGTEEEFASADKEIAADNAAASSHGGADDDEEEDVSESLKLDEWANEAGQNGTDAQFEQDIEFMTKVISGGLNKPKSTGQTTIPVIAGQVSRMEDPMAWARLAGIKK